MKKFESYTSVLAAKDLKESLSLGLRIQMDISSISRKKTLPLARKSGTRMKDPIISIFIAMLFITGCEQSQVAEVGKMKFPEGSVQHAVYAEDIQWQPCPPNLPADCEMAVLEGNPRSPDLFTVRFRTSGGFVMPPHTHPKDERVTVLQGKMHVAFGMDGTRENAKQFGPGDYYVNSRDAIHTVWGDSLSIIQITGIGPWEARFVENSSK